MSAEPISPDAVAYVNRWRRRVVLCSCGAEYVDDASGRLNHQRLHEHKPSPAPEGGVR